MKEGDTPLIDAARHDRAADVATTMRATWPKAVARYTSRCCVAASREVAAVSTKRES